MKEFNIELSAIIEAETEAEAEVLAAIIARSAANGYSQPQGDGYPPNAKVTSCEVEVVVPRRSREPVLVA